MPVIDITSVHQTSELMQSYATLLPHQKIILQISALLLGPTQYSELYTGLSKSSWYSSTEKKPTALVSDIARLKNLKLLEQNDQCSCWIQHALTLIALDESNPMAKEVFETFQQFKSNKQRLMHLAIYENDANLLAQHSFGSFMVQWSLIDEAFYNTPLPIEWIQSRAPLIQAYLCLSKLAGVFTLPKEYPPDFMTWYHFYTTQILDDNFLCELALYPMIRRFFVQINVVIGRLDQAPEKLILNDPVIQAEYNGLQAFLNQDYPQAILHYEYAEKICKKNQPVPHWITENLHGFFYFLSLVHQTDEDKINTFIRKWRKEGTWSKFFTPLLEAIALGKQGRVEASRQKYHAAISKQIQKPNMPIAYAWLNWLVLSLQPSKIEEPQSKKILQDQLMLCLEQHNYLYAQLLTELIIACDAHDKRAQDFFTNHPYFRNFRFLNILPIRSTWEMHIDELQSLLVNKKNLPNQFPLASHQRMAWFIDPDKKQIEVGEQKMLKNGKWSNGRSIALQRLHHPIDPNLEYLTAQDKAALMGLNLEQGWYRDFYWDTTTTFNALIGHPHLFHLKNKTIPLELVRGELELNIEEVSNQYRLTLSHCQDKPGVILVKETPNRYQVIDFSEKSHRIAQILSNKGLSIPLQAKEKIIHIITEADTGIRIHSDLAEDDLPTIEGCLTCYVHLLPINDGLKLSLWVRPFEQDGPYCRPGKGQPSLIATRQIDNQSIRQKAIRAFRSENKSKKTLLNQCPTLLDLDDGTDEWYLESLETSLEVLTELETYKEKHALIIEWPKGQTLKLMKNIGAKDLRMSIKGSQQWFEYEGEVELNNQEVLQMKTLLDLLETSHGRFIRMADNSFLALTHQFKKQLEELKKLSEDNKIYHLSSGVLQKISGEAGELKVNKAWQSHLHSLQSMEKFSPTLPSTLQATLRDYQLDGFHYLSRLTHWGIGACLADDMGLGKTVQTIAVLLNEATHGACLIVAPTSVCFNWSEELKKFAPTLNIHRLHESSDRGSTIQKLSQRDILICSYHLLHTAGDSLSAKQWHIIVLDEAQAIKNFSTKRAQNAMKLQSNRRIALSGTPIENHLGELWSLFRFLNPGLLGSQEHFQQNFISPIEKQSDPVAKRALKQLVSPYILRRSKSEVLTELPAKTEQSILIEPTAEETAFYEAVRQTALQRISELNASKDNQRRFSILAEISRLRQACCHPSLVDEQISLEGSKIKAFVTLVKELMENQHKVLVFSQFVRYLQIVRRHLEQEKIDFQYLDGRTPLAQRKKSTQAFQAGKGDVFLISLKAGGMGLNLTAADYVIILDPWWNPAVEDQAADRAHRIGQQRPVTVYRLIMKNTIEEKIIKLHQNKRDLASDLLSGGDMSGKMSEQELLDLMRG